jgi:protein-S-isoprenylcysteine O-methyltransferase Ste14
VKPASGPAAGADPGIGALHFAWRGWILAALLAALAFARWRSAEPLAPGWLAFLAAGLAWRAWAGAHIAEHSNGAAWAGVSLAASGPYRISRHPLYFANLLCAAGLVLFAHCLPLWADALVLALAFAHHEALARSEEAFLSAAAGDAYRGYMRVTPRWPGPPAGRGGWRWPKASADAGDGGRDGTETSARGWRAALSRQGWNVAKGGACAAAIWFAAACR